MVKLGDVYSLHNENECRWKKKKKKNKKLARFNVKGTVNSSPYALKCIRMKSRIVHKKKKKLKFS